ncbi:AAA family ATPase [Oxalobacteraceae bacterium OM1]|nr:AAA family ATPase [Oxalobacteraceae bacterium OM1]
MTKPTDEGRHASAHGGSTVTPSFTPWWIATQTGTRDSAKEHSAHDDGPYDAGSDENGDDEYGPDPDDRQVAGAQHEEVMEPRPPLGKRSDSRDLDPEWDWPEPPLECRHRFKKIVDRDAVEDVAAIYRQYVSDAERRDAIAKIINHLRQTGAWRELPMLPYDWHARLDRLERTFPNFLPFFAYVRSAIAIAEREGMFVHLEPVLLVGPPGVGKSLLAQQLAELLNMKSHTVRMETAQSAAELVGTADFWSSRGPGLLLKHLVYGKQAGFVVFIDEISRSTADRYDPLGPLYSLLEQDSAKNFIDVSAPWLSLDTSAITWIAACNEVDSLPGPIRNRMKIIDIPAPTREQSRAIATQLWRQLRQDLPRATIGIALTDDAFDMLSTSPPRVIRKLLREALGRAVFDNRTEINAGDIRACQHEACLTARRCGFV